MPLLEKSIETARESPWADSLSIAPDEPRTATCRRVLFVSYPFPPVGGAGVQRVAKFIKYLPDFGWQSSVLTVSNPSVPAYDASLVADIPEQTIVRKARTFEPSYAVKSVVASGGGRSNVVKRMVSLLGRRLSTSLLQPDPQVLWLPAAVLAGRRLLREVPHHAIVATGPPFSTFLIGAMLQRASGVPLVLDYRDEWGLSNRYLENKQVGPVTQFVQERMQRLAARHAAALMATTRASAQSLELVRDRAGSKARVTWIYNGFDPADFPTTPASKPTNAATKRFRLVYVGTLWNLTSVAPLVAAVRLLAEQSPELAGQLELVFAGRRTASQQELLQPLRSLPCRLIEHPYLDHAQALQLTRSADGLCVLLSDVRGADRVVPAKLFECMAARRPILGIVPPGECWDLLGDYPDAYRLMPSDVPGIARAITEVLERHTKGTSLSEEWNGEEYDRRTQAGELADLLESLA
jgi:glycosyltransferase involved in cell wall biosynthesis